MGTQNKVLAYILYLVILIVFVRQNGASVDLTDIGCGPFVDNYLLGITEKSFTATSGHTGIPSLKGIAWKPTVMSVDQTLTIDLGQKMEISKFSFGGDGNETVPSPAPTEIILYYSDDGVNFTCLKKPLGSCKGWQSTAPPMSLSGAHVSTYDIVPALSGRYIKIDPIEPAPTLANNGSESALRVEFYGCTPVVPAIDIIFAISATSGSADQIFTTMKNTCKEIVTLYGIRTMRHATIVFGTNVVTVFNLTNFTTKADAHTAIDAAVRENGIPDLIKALQQSKTVFENSPRGGARRILIVMMDRSSSASEVKCKAETVLLRRAGAMVVGVGVGRMMPVPDLGWITLNSYYVMLRPPTANVKHMCIGIMTRALKDFDVTFAIGATMFESFEAMRVSIGAIVDKYGVDTVHYSIVVYGPGVNNSVIRYSYTEFLQYNATTFKTLVDNTSELVGSGDLPVDDALRKCKITFDDAKVRSGAEKDVVIMMDKDTNIDAMTIRNIADSMETSGLRIIPVGIGPGVTRRQLLTIATNWYDVIYEAVPRNATPEKLQERTMDKVYRLYVQEIDLCFMLNAASIQADTLYTYMYNTMRSIIHQYSFGRLRYSFILYGDVPATYYSFDTIFPNKEILLRAVSRIKKATGGSGMDQAFEHARAIYTNASLARSESWKILVTMMDKRSGLSEAKLKSLSAPLQDLGVLIIPVALGRYIDALECYYISAFRDNVMLPAINQSFVATGEIIMNRVVHFPQIDIVFVLSASSMKSSTTFSLMQNCILKIGSKFGVYTFHYSVILYGSSSVKKFDFNTAFPYREALIEESNNLVKENGSSAITEALSLARTVLNDASARSNVRRGVAVIFDKATGKTVQQLQSAARPLHDEGVIVVASGVGPEVTKEEARAMTSRRNDATHVNDTYQPGPLGDHIVRRILKDGTEEMDIVFAMTLSSTSPHTMLMKTIIQMLIRRYGIYRIHYGAIVFGQTASTAFDFDSAYSDDKLFLDVVNGLAKVDDSAANVTLAMEEAYKIFTTSTTRKESRKVLVIMIDRLTLDDQEKLKLARKRLGDLGVTIITVALGSTVDSSKIYDYCPYRGNTIYSKDGGISWDMAEKIIEKITRIPELDLTFTLSADSATPEQIYVLMKEIIKSFTTKFGTSKFRVGVVNAGSSPTRVFDFSDSLPDNESFKNEIEKISRIPGSPDIPKALEEVYKVFNESSSRPTAKKYNVIIVDRPLNVAEPDIRTALKPFDEKNIITIAVGIQKANKTELVAYTESKRAVIQANATDSPMDTMDEVMKVILNDDLKPSYVTFAVSAAGINATKTLNFIKDVIKKTISRHGGTDNMNINVIVFGDKASEVISFDSDLSEEELLKAVDSIPLPTGEPSIKAALDEVRKRFNESGAPADAKKLCVLMWDNTTSDSEADLKLVSDGLKEDDITLLSMPLSPEAALDAPKFTEPLLTKPPSDVPMAVETILYDGGISLLASPCEPNPCQNGGVCTESGCMCPSSYYGTYCENRKGDEIGCGSLLDGYLLSISNSAFSASSGTPTNPVLSGSAWTPTVADKNQYLTIDLGVEVKLSGIAFGGKPGINASQALVRVSYSTDGSNYAFVKDDGKSSLKEFQSSVPPPVPGHHITYAGLPRDVDARYVRFHPNEPVTLVDALSLRVEVYGCVSGHYTPDLHMMFAFSATSTIPASTFSLMSTATQNIINLYGIRTIKYSAFTFGNITQNVVNFEENLTKTKIIEKLKSLSPIPGGPNLQEALVYANKRFVNYSRPNARRVLVVFMDKGSGVLEASLSSDINNLRNNEVLTVGVGVGREDSIPDVEWMALNRFYVMRRSPNEDPMHLGRDIMTRVLKVFDVTFVISASTNKNFGLIKSTLQSIIAKYGIKTIHYSILRYGSTTADQLYSFTSSSSFNKNGLNTKVSEIAFGDGSTSAIEQALALSKASFTDLLVRISADHIVVVITDKDSGADVTNIKTAADSLENEGIRIIPVGIGNNVKGKEASILTSNNKDVIKMADSTSETKLQEEIMKNIYRLYMPDIDLIFIMNAASADSENTYTYMQNIVKSIIQRYNYGRIHYTFIIHGDTPIFKYSFGEQFPSKDAVLKAVSKLPRTTKGSSLDKALLLARDLFIKEDVRRNSWKIIVPIMDIRTGLSSEKLRNVSSMLHEIGVRVVPVGVGEKASPRELDDITAYEDHVVLIPKDTSYVETGEEAMNRVLQISDVDVVYALSTSSNSTFKTMTDSIKKVGDKFGTDRFHYSIVVYGNSTKNVSSFDTIIPYEEALEEEVNKAIRQSLSGNSNLEEALTNAKKILNTPTTRKSSRKAVVIITDNTSGKTPTVLKDTAKPLHEQGIIVVSSGIGDVPNYDELRSMTLRKEDVVKVKPGDTSGYLGDRIVARILKDGIPEIDLVFAISPSIDKKNISAIMKDILKSIIQRYGDDKITYSVITYGSDSSSEIALSDQFPDLESLINAVDSVGAKPSYDAPNLEKAMDEAKLLFQEAPIRSNARKVFVPILDRNTENPEQVLKAATKSLQDLGATIVPVGIGDDVSKEELDRVTIFKDNVIKPASDVPFYDTGEEIISKIIGVPEVFVTFAVTPNKNSTDKVYKLMKDTISSLTKKYGKKIRPSVVTFDEPPKVLFDFEDTLPTEEALKRKLDGLPKREGLLDFTNTLKKVENIFNSTELKPTSKKALVVLTDQKFAKSGPSILESMRPLDEKAIRPIVVPLGDDINEEELLGITRTKRKIIKPSDTDGGMQLGDEIMKAILNDGLPELDITFAISATAQNATKTIEQAKLIIKSVEKYYGTDKVHYSVVIFGDNATTPIQFNDGPLNEGELLKALENLKNSSGQPNFKRAIDEVKNNLNTSSGVRPDAVKVVVPIFDAPLFPEEPLLDTAQKLKEESLIVVPVPVQPLADNSQAELLTPDKDNVRPTVFGDDPMLIGEGIIDIALKESCSKSPCLNGGTCVKNGATYSCLCFMGYSGKNCEIGCGHMELGVMVYRNDGNKHRRVSDEDITASSSLDKYPPHRGRLYMDPIGSYGSGWCASPIDATPYLQIHFGLPMMITTITTRGILDGPNGTAFVKSYYISYTNDTEARWYNYTEPGQAQPYVFKSAFTAVPNNVSSMVLAKFLRIYPLKGETSFCMQAAVHGCDPLAKVPAVDQRPEKWDVDVTKDGESYVWIIPLALIPILMFTTAIPMLLRFGPGGSWSSSSTSSFLKNLKFPPTYNQKSEIQTVLLEFGDEDGAGEGGGGGGESLAMTVTGLEAGGYSAGGGGGGSGGAAYAEMTTTTYTESYAAYSTVSGTGASGSGAAAAAGSASAGGAGGAGGASAYMMSASGGGAAGSSGSIGAGAAGGAGAGAAVAVSGGGGGGGYAKFESNSHSISQQQQFEAEMGEIDIMFDMEGYSSVSMNGGSGAAAATSNTYESISTLQQLGMSASGSSGVGNAGVAAASADSSAVASGNTHQNMNSFGQSRMATSSGNGSYGVGNAWMPASSGESSALIQEEGTAEASTENLSAGSGMNRAQGMASSYLADAGKPGMDTVNAAGEDHQYDYVYSPDDQGMTSLPPESDAEHFADNLFNKHNKIFSFDRQYLPSSKA